MRCSIDPFRKPTKHRPAGFGESATQLFRHYKAMLRGRTRANHRNRFAGIQMPEQRSSPLDKQPSRRGVRLVQTAWPGRITWQNSTVGDLKIGLRPLRTSVSIDGALTVRRPAQRLAKTLCGPAPELIWPNGSGAAERAQIRHA